VEAEAKECSHRCCFPRCCFPRCCFPRYCFRRCCFRRCLNRHCYCPMTEMVAEAERTPTQQKNPIQESLVHLDMMCTLKRLRLQNRILFHKDCKRQFVTMK